MFEEMVASIEADAAKYVMKAEIRNNLEREEVVKGAGRQPERGWRASDEETSASRCKHRA